jgi:hypothetical protein
MATHDRTKIRAAACSALVLAATVAGDRVMASRVMPWRELELPALAVYTDDEEIDESNAAPRELDRDMEMVVIGAVQLNPATFAAGSVTVTGSNGSTVPLGALLKGPDGQPLRTTAAATVAAGVATPPVKAVLGGRVANLAAGAAVTFHGSPPAGVNAAGVVAAGGLTGGDAAEDALDELLSQVEAAFNADRYLGTLNVNHKADDTIPARLETAVLDDGERPIAMFRATYAVAYQTLAVAVEDPNTLDNFLTGATAWDLGGVQDADDQAQDEVELEPIP